MKWTIVCQATSALPHSLITSGMEATTSAGAEQQSSDQPPVDYFTVFLMAVAALFISEVMPFVRRTQAHGIVHLLTVLVQKIMTSMRRDAQSETGTPDEQERM